MKYFIEFIKQNKGRTLLSLVLLLGQVFGTLLIPALIANVVDHGILLGDMEVIKRVGIQMLMVAFLSTMIAVWGSWETSNLGSKFGRDMRKKLFQKTQDLSIQQFDELGVSSLITRSTSDITNLQQAFGMMLQMVVPAPIIVVVSMIMTFLVSPLIALIQLCFMLLLLLFAAYLLKKSNKLSRSVQVRLDHINRVVREAITGVRVIRSFGNERYEEERSTQSFEAYANHMIRLNRLFAVFNPAVWLLMGALMVIILGVGGVLSLQQTMAVGQISAVIEYATITMAYLMMAIATLTILPKALACLRRLEEVLDTQASIQDQTVSESISCPVTEALVSFDQVSFSYAGAEEKVLHALSFELSKGKTTAVIGSTGSGKSTLADILLRLHEVQEGSITLMGKDIKDYSQETLREKIACVPQKAFLFSGSIADNLRMGDAQAKEEDMWKALEIAQAKDFVEHLPKGLNAPVSQGGKNFSGGQRQRLAIARALVKKADVFIFDDSFSALDVKTDAALRKALQQHMKTAATLIIAQRVSSIMDADQILVLEEGKLVGRGTHAQLVETCDTYRAIVESQLQQKEVS